MDTQGNYLLCLEQKMVGEKQQKSRGYSKKTPLNLVPF